MTLVAAAVRETPERTCVGCRERHPARTLVRCCLGADGTATVSRIAPGRGAWVCATSLACFDRAAQRKGFDRAWKRPVSSDTVSQLRDAFVAHLETMRYLQSAGSSAGTADNTKD